MQDFCCRVLRGFYQILTRYFSQLLVVSISLQVAHAQNPQSLPRFTLSDLVYEGAFRIPSGDELAESIDSTDGQIEYNPQRNTVYLTAHAVRGFGRLAEFRVPTLVKSTKLSELNFSGDPLQDFSSNILNRSATGNPDGLNSIRGLRLMPFGGSSKLVFNAIEWYDADGNAYYTTGVVRDPNNLATSPVDGLYVLQGGSGHVACWLSPIPPAWQTLLRGTYVTACGGDYSIIGRGTPGPAMFTFNPERDLLGSSHPDPIPTTRFLDYTIDDDHLLHTDNYNDSGTNDLWTRLSGATYGFVVPGTRTYLAIGHSGGHVSGVQYKGTDQCGNGCGGHCPKDCNDDYLYYWAYDLNDLIPVANGQKQSYEPRPYEYGKWPSPFGTETHGGATFDPASGRLWELHKSADTVEPYSNRPVIVVSKFRTSSPRPNAPGNFRQMP